MSSMVTNHMNMNKSRNRSGIMDKYINVLAEDENRASDQWKTMYKTSYRKPPSTTNQTNIANVQYIEHRETQGFANFATRYRENHAKETKNSKQFLEQTGCLSRKEGISIQHVANNNSNIAGYGIVDGTKGRWFAPDAIDPTWQTMYQTQFPKPVRKIVSQPNVTNSSAQYSLEQVFRHMGKGVENSRIEQT